MNKMKHVFSVVVSVAMMVAMLFVVPVQAAGNYVAQLYGKITDAGQVVNKVVIDYGDGVKVSGADKDTYTVHATNYVQIGSNDGKVYSDADRTIEKVEVAGGKVTLYMNESEGATLTWLSESRNYPGKINYTITQNEALKATSVDGRDLEDITGEITCDNTVIDEETAKFTSVKGSQGINYQFHEAKGADKLVVWFHGNGEGDLEGYNTQNNVAQMLANRGTVAWATDEAQNIFGGAHVMSFQAPATWYYAQRDNLLEKAKTEIEEVIKKYNINPNKVVVSGCSAGGYMTTRMLIAYPDLFSAAMINCPALDTAAIRGGETPTDEELASLKNSKTAIWLVQGKTDSSVKSEVCSQRIFKILTDGAELTTTRVEQEFNSSFTTSETKDGKYKLSLYDTVDLEDKVDSLGETRPCGKLKFEEDYNLDGVKETVKYSDHWSWIYTLRNNPSDASGTHIWNWAATYMKDATPVEPEKPTTPENKPSTDKTDKTDKTNKTDTTNKTETTIKKDPVKTGDTTAFAAYIAMFVAAAFGIILARRKRA